MRINLNISEQTKTSMKKTCEENHICMSALMDVLLNNFCHEHYLPETYYLDDNKKSQTTIIVNEQNKQLLIKANWTCYSCFLSNVVWAWYHLDKINIDQKTKNDIKSRVNQQFKQKKDKYWDYNRQYRNFYRARKQYERELQAKNER